MQQLDSYSDLFQQLGGIFSLVALITNENQPEECPVPPVLYLHGNPSTLKSTLTKQVAYKNIPAKRLVFTDCVAKFTPQLIFEHIINNLAADEVDCNKSWIKCRTENNFIMQLRALLSDKASRFLVRVIAY